RRMRGLRQLAERDRLAEHRPDPRERALDRRHGAAANLDAGVAPRFRAAGRVADPVAADAEPGDERDGAVDGDHFAMVARQPAERAFEPRRVIAAHVDSGVAKPLPEAPRRLAEIAHPVVDQPYGDAVLRLRDHRVREFEADLVLADEVALEVDVMRRLRDRVEPRGIVLARV